MSMLARNLRSLCVPLLIASLLAGCQNMQSKNPLGLESLEKAKQAFLDSWTKHAGETYTTEKLSRVADTTDSFVSFDAMSKDKTVVKGYAQYAGIWGPGMAGFKTAQLSETENVHVWIREGMAVTASIVRVHGETMDGTMIDMPGHLTLGWLREGDDWRVVHEHMSLGVKQ
ncbi:MAG TPA: nuclear transport factor 2 family protein [Planctomycetota bacterium]|nr:nuclear transport factor 2 family protein [Planctomycetota bacterium]